MDMHRTPGDGARRIEPELLSDEELERLCDVELVERPPLDDYEALLIDDELPPLPDIPEQQPT